MKPPAPGFLHVLEQAAVAAQQEELRFRASVAAEIAKRERERQFAYRRVEIAKVLSRAAATATSPDDAIPSQLLAFRRELGWHGDSEQRRTALEKLKPVAETIWRELDPEVTPDLSGEAVRNAMAEFEAWYIGQFGTNYLASLDRDMPEIPVVEF